jgi:hypothetical protein
MNKVISARRGQAWTGLAAIAAIAAVLGAVLTGPAVVAAKTRLSRSKTVTVHSHTTKTINVGYPAALKYKGAKYSCTAKISGPGKSGGKILSRGSALGGTVCRVKVRNNNKIEDPLEDIKVKVTATTTY